MEMLKRVEEEDKALQEDSHEDGDASALSLEERLAGLDLGEWGLKRGLQPLWFHLCHCCPCPHLFFLHHLVSSSSLYLHHLYIFDREGPGQ